MNIKKELHVEALAGLSVARPGPVTNRRNTVAVDENVEWQQIAGVLAQPIEESANAYPARVLVRRHTAATDRYRLGEPLVASVPAATEIENGISLPASNGLAQCAMNRKIQNGTGNDASSSLQTESDNLPGILAGQTSNAFDMGEIASAIENLQVDGSEQRDLPRPLVFDDTVAPMFVQSMPSINPGQSPVNMSLNRSAIDNESFAQATIPACSTPLRPTQRRQLPGLIPILPATTSNNSSTSRGVEEPAINNASTSRGVEEPSTLPNLATHPLEFAAFLAKKISKN